MEIRASALRDWWVRHNKSFGIWFLSLTDEERRVCIIAASPDIPETTAATREANGEILFATDMILPELSLEALLAQGGKLLILLFARRLVALDSGFQQDINFLNGKYKRNSLPSYSAGRLRDLDTPFVDPLDPDENVNCLSATTPPSLRAQTLAHLECGRLVHAEVYLALQIRREALTSFIVNIVLQNEAAMVEPLAPSFQELEAAEKDIVKLERGDNDVGGLGATASTEVVGEGDVHSTVYSATTVYSNALSTTTQDTSDLDFVS